MLVVTGVVLSPDWASAVTLQEDCISCKAGHGLIPEEKVDDFRLRLQYNPTPAQFGMILLRFR
jgi:hypothetical protein